MDVHGGLEWSWMCLEAWSSHGCAWRLGVAWMCMEAYGTYCVQVMHGKEQKEKKQTWILGNIFLVCFYTSMFFFFCAAGLLL